jgi:hypothetical protein
MVNHRFENFLFDDREYRLSEEHWVRLWEHVDPPSRERFGWRQPWFQPLSRDLGEGNPIFSACSPMLRRGIRVIQHAPTESGLEVQMWTDFFGGSSSDADRIEELVISCALSDLASDVVLTLREPWVKGEPCGFDEGPVASLTGSNRELTPSDLGSLKGG